MSYKLEPAPSALTRCFGVVSFLALLSAASGAWAEKCEVAQVPNISGQTIAVTNENFAKLANCVSGLSAKLEQTSAALVQADAELTKVQGILAAFETGEGAVVAFNRSEKDGSCPIGWRKLEEATGRFIVGAGVNGWSDGVGRPISNHPSLMDDPVGAVGGEEVHQLATDEMPSHDHSNGAFNLLVTRNGKEVAEHAVPQNIDINARKGQPIEAVGRNLPHNNMPPYVALFYCIKN
jgi:hypothetical protein